MQTTPQTCREDLARVLNIFTDLQVSEETRHKSFEELGLDSLDYMEITMELSALLGPNQLPGTIFDKVNTYQELEDLFVKLVNDIHDAEKPSAG